MQEELAALLEKKKARAARFDVPLVTTSKEVCHLEKFAHAAL